MTDHNENSELGRTDARLTAYALGELDDVHAAEIETLIATDADARAVVEEVRAMSALLGEALGSEPVPEMSEAGRAAVSAAATPVAPEPAGSLRNLWPLVGMAATVVGGFVIAETFAGRSAAFEYPEDRVSALGVADRDGPKVYYERVTSLGGQARSEDILYPVAAQRSQKEAALASSAAAARGAEAAESNLRSEYFRRESRNRATRSEDGTVGAVGTASRTYYYGGGGGSGAGHGQPGTASGRDTPRYSTSSYGVSSVPGGTSGDPMMETGPTAGDGGGADGSRPAPDSKFAPTGASGRMEDIPDQRPGSRSRDPSRTPIAGDRAETGVLFDRLALAPEEGGKAVVGFETIRAEEIVRLYRSNKIGLTAGTTVLGTDLPGPVVNLLHSNPNVALDAKGVKLVRVLADGYLDDVDVEKAMADLRRIVETAPTRERVGSEDYEHPGEATFRNPRNEPLSTFSIDVDTASYANTRRFLNNGQLPPPSAVRIEELVNYFSYDYEAPDDGLPVAASIELAACPWNTEHKLARIGLRARDLEEAPGPSNLVFLIDVSGSMRPADKLPLVQQGLQMLVNELGEDDRIAIVTYSGNAGVALEPTTGDQKETINNAIKALSSGGSTNGASGIQTAYEMARKHFIKGGVNRVILATDGDFNVGVTSRTDLMDLIKNEAKSNVFLSVLGVGTGNIKDATLEQLADQGNGNYSYLDGIREAQKVLVAEMEGTLVTVAKDVKIQIEFNPQRVASYRLVGYENRMLAARDFNDDTKDAGEMGAGHTVTALFEIVPHGAAPTTGVDPLRYQPAAPAPSAEDGDYSDELLVVKFRYKQPDGDKSSKIEFPVTDSNNTYASASSDFKFAAAVAAFGHLIRRSPSAQDTSFDAVMELAGEALGDDPHGRRAEFLDLALKAKKLMGR